MSRLQPPRPSGLQKPGSTTAPSPGRGSLLTRPSATSAVGAGRGRGIGLGLARGPSGSTSIPGSSTTSTTTTRRSNPTSPGTARVPGAHGRSPSLGGATRPSTGSSTSAAARRLGSSKGRSTPIPYQVDERVRVDSLNLEGTVRYLGPTHFKPGTWAGLELDVEGSGKNDGSVGGETYFSCPPATGIFVLVSKISKLEGDSEPGPKTGTSTKTGLTRRSSSISSSSTASSSLQFRPESRAGRFVGMTAQQYKRASLLNGPSGRSISTEDSGAQGPGMSPSKSLPSKTSPSSTSSKSSPSSVLAAARSRISTPGARPTNGVRSASGSTAPRAGIPGTSPRTGMHQRTVSQSTRKSTSTASSTSSSPQRRKSLNQTRLSGPLSPPGSKSLISPPPSSIQEHLGSSRADPSTSSTSDSPGMINSEEVGADEEGQGNRDPVPDYAEKLQARLAVLEAENRLLRVQGEQVKARLVATELLDKGNGSGESGEDLPGVGSAEIAQLRARVTQLATERDLASEERDALQKRLVGMQRPSTVLSGIKGSSRTDKDGIDGTEEEEDEHEQVLRLTERVREGDERVRTLEEALEVTRAGVVGEEMAGRLRSLEEALADAESLLSSKGDEERTLRERLEELEREVAFQGSSRSKPEDSPGSGKEREEGGEGETGEEGGAQDLKARLEDKVTECGQLSARLDRLATEGERDRSVLVAQVEGLRAAGMETITLYEGKIAALESRLALFGSGGDEDEGEKEKEKEEGDDEEKQEEEGRRRDEVENLREALSRAEREMDEAKEMHELRMEELRLELSQIPTDKMESAEPNLAEGREQEDQAKDERMREEREGWEQEVKEAKEEGDRLRQVLAEAQESLEKERLEAQVKEEELRLEMEEALDRVRQEAVEAKSSLSKDTIIDPQEEGIGKTSEGHKEEKELLTLQAKFDELQEIHQSALEENESLQAAQENLVEAHRQVENECFKLMDEVERLHSESLLATPLGPEEDAGIRVVEREADKEAGEAEDEANKEGGGGEDKADPSVVAAVAQGAEAVQRLLTEKQRQLEGRERAFRDEILRLTRRVATLERERVDEVGARERDIADLESLVEAKIFREADLEEQLERGARQIRELQEELEKLKGSGAGSTQDHAGHSSHRALGHGTSKTDLSSLSSSSSPSSRAMRSRSSSLSSAALYCELCEVDGHEITSCPAVLGTGAPTPPRISTYSYGSDAGANEDGSDAEGRDDSMNVDGLVMGGDGSFVYGGAGDDDEEFDKPYCENCEEFGAHWTEDCPEGDATY